MSAAREPIFDTTKRTHPVPKRHGESLFSFFNRVAGSYWEHARQLVQTWADHLDDPHDYRAVRGYLRSGRDDQFRSAFLELYLHECLRKAGYTVTVHPNLPGTNRHPDFYAERAGEGFYLEAIAPSSSAAELAAANRRGAMFDIVNQLQDPHFLLWLSHLEQGSAAPAAGKLRKELKRWLAGLDPDDYHDANNLPEWSWSSDGWSVTFRAIPKDIERRGIRPGDRIIGVHGETIITRGDDTATLHAALAEKDHAYPNLNAPFIIAVGVDILGSPRWDVSNALYGHVAVSFRRDTTGVLVFDREIRQPDGYFGTPPSWRNHQVSGLLVINNVMPYHFIDADATLWRHPAPAKALHTDLGLPWATTELDETQLRDRPAPISAAELLGFVDPWPPGDPWLAET
ncbi:hypothetical protein ACIP5Y_40690 [Nocardia sp. NPDC088792]|uniref:hypothetical protein n=1 Tax=Nocardia sp. NPDC088792 TaxID=3364332 RepID=UPI0038052BAB